LRAPKRKTKLRRNRRFRLSTKAASPVIAVLLTIAIAVAAAILLYVWSMGLIGALQTGGGQQVREQIELDAYKWTAGGTLDLYVRNVGNKELVVDAVYVEGVSASSNMGTTLSVYGPVVKLQVTPVGTYTPGVAYTLKIVTKTGGVFTFSVIYGHGA